MTAPTHNATQHRAARVAGAAYFIIIVTSLLSVALGFSALTMGGVLPDSLQDIADHQLTHRVGAVYDLLMYAGVVLLSVALYVVLEPVDPGVALLALLWRTLEAAFGCVTVLCSLVVLHLAGSEGMQAALGPEQLMGTVSLILEASSVALTVLLVFLCLGTALNSYLFFRSRYIPRWLSGWGMAACTIMLIGGVVEIIAPQHAAIPEALGAMAVIPFEIVIGLWLWVKGIDTRSA